MEAEKILARLNKAAKSHTSRPAVRGRPAAEVGWICTVEMYEDKLEEAAADIAAAHAAEMEEMREVLKWAWGVIHDAYDQPIEDDERDEALEKISQALAATPKRVRWMETFSLNDQGHIFVRAQTGYDDDWQYWFDDFLEPGQSVAVAVLGGEDETN